MFDKITARVKKLCYGFDPKHIDPQVIAMPHTHAISAGGVTPSMAMIGLWCRSSLVT